MQEDGVSFLEPNPCGSDVAFRDVEGFYCHRAFGTSNLFGFEHAKVLLLVESHNPFFRREVLPALSVKRLGHPVRVLVVCALCKVGNSFEDSGFVHVVVLRVKVCGERDQEEGKEGRVYRFHEIQGFGEFWVQGLGFWVWVGHENPEC